MAGLIYWLVYAATEVGIVKWNVAMLCSLVRGLCQSVNSSSHPYIYLFDNSF